MTRFHTHHGDTKRECVNSRAEPSLLPELTRREFLQSGIAILSGALLPRILGSLDPDWLKQGGTGKRIYIAPDDHTDLFWTADLATYENAFVEMLDFYLDLADQTEKEPDEFQSRWNCD